MFIRRQRLFEEIQYYVHHDAELLIYIFICSSDQTSKMNNCYYSELINSIPEEACTVAEVLHCMVEQVCDIS